MLEAVVHMLEEAEADVGGDRRIRLAPDQVLIEEGDLADTVYILMDGSLSVAREVDGSQVALTMLDEPGTVVGEIVALGGGTRSATVTATTDSEVFAFKGSEFEQLVRSHPALAEELTALAARRSEEVELLHVLATRFGITDDESVAEAITSVDWRRLRQGDVLFREATAPTLYTS